jgi:molybdate transport system ATP-binding protein
MSRVSGRSGRSPPSISERPSPYVGVRLARIGLVRAERRVLKDIDWTIRPGERWILAGGNGAGKTQLLKMLAGSVWPTPGEGSIAWHWKGRAWSTPQEVQEEIAYLGPERQDRYERYGWNHTVEQIVGTGLHRTDIPLDALTAADRGTIAKLLSRLGIDSLAPRRFLTLSYGERRLTLLARALASRPKLLLLDELLNGLDAENRLRALAWLEGSARSARPWVLATHRHEDVPRSATHALVLEQGRVVYRGSIERAPLERWLGSHEAAPRRRAKSPDAKRATARREITTTPRKSGSVLVRLRNASVYADGHRILDRISMEVRCGECWVVHGANGAGKTTLLRTIYGDHGVASGGRIERAGIEPGVPLERFKRRVGLIAPHLQAEYPQQLTVDEVVLSGRHASVGLAERPSSADRAAARRALEEFELTSFAGRTLRELSYGQLRRVLFARAWTTRPRLLLLDEPFAGVDTPTRRVLARALEALAARGAAIVMATHHRSEWPSCTSHELELADGRAVYCGPVRR